jgi:mRNA interferase MazF
VVKRGEIWWASLPAPQGSSPGYRRPVVIIQSNDFNESRIQTVVIAAITPNLRLAAAPGNVTVSSRGTGLPAKSVVNVSQLLTVTKSLLTERLGRLDSRALQQVDDGLRLVLAL